MFDTFFHTILFPAVPDDSQCWLILMYLLFVAFDDWLKIHVKFVSCPFICISDNRDHGLVIDFFRPLF